MANPILGGIGLGGSILGSIMGAGAARSQANAQAGSLQYQAALSMFNAQVAEQNANYAEQEGEKQAAKYGLGARQTAAQIKAGQAASGLDVNSGSATEVQESQHLVSRMDMDTIRANAAKTAYDYRTQAEYDKSQAFANLAGAEGARRAGRTNALASLIGGATSVADKWLKGKEVGLWNFGS